MSESSRLSVEAQLHIWDQETDDPRATKTYELRKAIWDVLPDEVVPELTANALLNVLAEIIARGSNRPDTVAANIALALPEIVKFYVKAEEAKKAMP